MLEDLKTLLDIERCDTTQDKKLRLILDSVECRLLLLLGMKEMPEDLLYIVTEVSVIRFNRIGSEGISSHSVEGESMTFTDNDFSGYMDDIQAYLAQQKNAQSGKVRFL